MKSLIILLIRTIIRTIILLYYPLGISSPKFFLILLASIFMSWSFFLPNFIAACESTSSIIPEWGPFQVAIEWQLSGKHCSRSEVKVDVVSDSLWPHGLYSPRNSPGQNTGVGSLSLLQRIFPTQRSNPGLQRSSFILLSYILGLKSNLFTGCGMSNNLCNLSLNVILVTHEKE